MYAQLSASIDKVFRCLDADGNGFLDRDELKAGFAAMVHSRPDIPNRGVVVPYDHHVFYSAAHVCVNLRNNGKLFYTCYSYIFFRLYTSSSLRDTTFESRHSICCLFLATALRMQRSRVELK